MLGVQCKECSARPIHIPFSAGSAVPGVQCRECSAASAVQGEQCSQCVPNSCLGVAGMAIESGIASFLTKCSGKHLAPLSGREGNSHEQA